MSAPFRPDWVSAPGETLAEALEERELTPAALAALIGYPVEWVEHVLLGRPLTPGMAAALERGLGISASFWEAREAQYRERVGGQ